MKVKVSGNCVTFRDEAEISNFEETGGGVYGRPITPKID